MVEHYTQGIVLGREPKGELDEVVVLYTKDLGKVIARAKSIRRITSKLSGHLTPGSIVAVRIGEKNGNGFQVIDALSEKFPVNEESLAFLDFLYRMIPLNLPDLRLWYAIEKIVALGRYGKEVYRFFLEIFGFDPRFAVCEKCGDANVAYFASSDIMFLCSKCYKRVGIHKDEVVAI